MDYLPAGGVFCALPIETAACALRDWPLRSQGSEFLDVALFTPTHSCKTMLAALSILSLAAQADDSVVVWPAGWVVQALAPGAPGAAAQISRQRAAKPDSNGDPAMVVELSHTRLAVDHKANVAAVLLEMRKTVQVAFSKEGYQSVCTTIHPGTLGNLPAMETTCKVLLNGGQIMTQTLVAAATQGNAWSLTYAGPTAGYAANEAAVQAIRDGLMLEPQP